MAQRCNSLLCSDDRATIATVAAFGQTGCSTSGRNRCICHDIEMAGSRNGNLCLRHSDAAIDIVEQSTAKCAGIVRSVAALRTCSSLLSNSYNTGAAIFFVAQCIYLHFRYSTIRGAGANITG